MPFDGKHLEQWQLNALELADFIERQPEEMFTMADFGDPACGTPGCIAGWAECLWPDEVIDWKLGLDEAVGGNLFTPHLWYQPRRYSRSQALATLRHYAMTGEVVWQQLAKGEE